MQNFPDTLQSQYYTSPTLTQLITNLNTVIDPSIIIEVFYQTCWDLDTAVGYGLDVYGRRVGVNRYLHVVEQNWFGFANTGGLPFNDGAFYTGEPVTDCYAISDQYYRQMILAKAALNITNCSYQAINTILMNILFPGRGNAYVADVTSNAGLMWFGFAEAGDALPFNQGIFFSTAGLINGANMQMTYVFDFPLSAVEIAIVVYSGVLPKPVGVVANYQYIQISE
jgi:hypothetical protein